MDRLGPFQKGNAKLRNPKEMVGSNFLDRVGLFEKGNAKLRNLEETGGSNLLGRLGLVDIFFYLSLGLFEQGTKGNAI